MTRMIQAGASEPVNILAVAADRSRITGLTNLKLSARRESDDKYVDWDDNSFQTYGGATQPLTVLTEVDAIGSPGLYQINESPDHVGTLDFSVLVGRNDNDKYTLTVIQDGSPQTAVNTPQVGEVEEGGHTDKLLVMMTFSYSQSADRLDGNIWIERNGFVLTTATIMGTCTVKWYDRDGNLQFTETDTTPDAQGFYKIQKATPGLVPDTLYYATAEIPVTGVGTISGGKGNFTF